MDHARARWGGDGSNDTRAPGCLQEDSGGGGLQQESLQASTAMRLNPTADAAIWARRGGRLSEHEDKFWDEGETKNIRLVPTNRLILVKNKAHPLQIQFGKCPYLHVVAPMVC